MADRGGELNGITAKRIVDLLAVRKMSQSELARVANLTDAAVSRYVSGERMPSGATLLNIAKALGTSTDYLLGATGEPDVVSKETDLANAFTLIARNAKSMTMEEKLKMAEIIFGREKGGK